MIAMITVAVMSMACMAVIVARCMVIVRIVCAVVLVVMVSHGASLAAQWGAADRLQSFEPILAQTPSGL